MISGQISKRNRTFIGKNGSLADKRPDLLKDWDYAKNSKGPECFTAFSSEKVWWKCSKCGYGWEAKIGNRSNGRGCPCCAHKKLVPGKNDLATTNPDLAAQWHPTKNGDLKPSDVMYGQARKVWWQCSNGHAYQATLNHRSGVNGTGCPICNRGRQTSFREQAFYYYLKKVFPDAISGFTAEWLERFELDIYIPSRKLALEYDGAAWHKEHNYEREHRKYELCVKKGVKLIRVKEKMPDDKYIWNIANDIISIQDIEGKDNFVRLLYFVLSKLDPRSNMWTRKDPRQIYSPISVDLERDRFEILQRTYHIKESFAKKYPSLAAEWHPSKNGNHKPEGFKSGSGFKAWWICPECQNEYEATISYRVAGTGCPLCSRKKQTTTVRKRRIEKYGGITNPRLLAEWDYEKNEGLRPQDRSPQSEDRVWWKCPTCGYRWQAKICNRQNGRGCPCCSNRVVVKGVNDLATKFPELVGEWDFEKNGSVTPDSVVPGCNKKVWWKCSKCGYGWEAPPSRRTSTGSGCRKCADKEIWNIRRAKKNEEQMDFSIS